MKTTMRSPVLKPSKVLALGIFAACAPVAAIAETTTIFAPGVSLTGGWYDVNKKSTENRSTSDFIYCWAASASNLIDYWNDSYSAAGNSLPNSIPDRKTSALGYTSGTFDLFLDRNNWNPQVLMGDYYDNKGADPRVALKWYFNGEKHNASNYAVPLPGTGGYWKNEYSQIQEKLGGDFIQDELGAYSTWGQWASDKSKTCKQIFSECVSAILKKGAAGMGANTSLRGGHAITLWGADFDALGIVSAVYITDSDDAEKTSGAPSLRRYAVDYDLDARDVYLSNTDYGNRNLIISLYGLTAYPIPEPSMFGLLSGTLALALLALRRRR